MTDYDFTGLSPSDFEAICRDLLEDSLGVPLQAFVTGRDNGIDLRHAPVSGKDWVVQCKHFARSGFAKLRSHLKKELPKIEKLRPQRYVLATSVGLTPSNVDSLFTMLAPYCQSKHDIIGRDDLNALLRQRPQIEQSHFKLWLTSQAVLSRVLHNDVFVQSLLTEQQIKDRLGLYVHTSSFDVARRKLEAEHVCILSGVPGVGKTTLAEMLLVEYLMKDWQIVAIHQNVSEGQKLFRPDADVKQVFYYDDFLGQISTGEKLGKNEDRALLQLLGAISRTANKRFVLTTREYILAKAKAEHEQLARSKIDLYRFVVSCDDYSELDKARILANHLYFAQVPQKHIAALVEDRKYRKIISHRNYSPRIIEWMTQMTETSACSAARYAAVFQDRLDNPADLWTHAYENQISEASRHLLLVLGSCGDGVFLSDLRDAFEALFLARAKQYGFATSPSSFEKALNELEGNFVRIERSPSQPVVSCHNPSILDFVDRRFSQHPEEVSDVLRHAVFFEQIERLFKVFHVGNSGPFSKVNQERKAEVVREAIDRTLLARSVRLTRTEQPAGQWRRSFSSVWERLRTCCRIGTVFPNEQVCRNICEQIDTHMTDVDRRSGELSEITALLDTIERCEWCDRRLVDKWSDSLWQSLLGMEDDFEETLDGLSAAAQWFVENRYRFKDAEAKEFVENLASAVSNEVDNRDGSDPERLGGDLSVVEEIAKTLGRDFSKEIQRLNEAISECGQMGDVSDDGDWRNRHSDACASSIESMFDALLE